MVSLEICYLFYFYCATLLQEMDSMIMCLLEQVFIVSSQVSFLKLHFP